MWGWFAASGSAVLKKVKRTMKKEDCLEILQENLKSSVSRLVLGCSWVFQQYNDAKLRSKWVKEWLNQVRTVKMSITGSNQM